MIRTALSALTLITANAWALTPTDCARLCQAQACKENISHLNFSRCAVPEGKHEPQSCWCVYAGASTEALLFRCLDPAGKILATTETNDACNDPCTSFRDDVNYARDKSVDCAKKIPARNEPKEKQLQL